MNHGNGIDFNYNQNENKMVCIYILLLQKNKYYVGKTTHPKFRLREHFDSGGSAWTKKYKPVKILQILPNCDDYDEDKYTKMYMDKHGINNVRGGSYSTIRLDKTTIAHLTRMSNGTNDKCFECGNNGHFAKYCPNRKKAKNDDESDEELCIWNSESDDEWSCSYCNKGFATKKGAQFHENVHCKVRKQMKNNLLASTDEDLEEGVYDVDGAELYWDGAEWYEESRNDPGHRDGTFGNQYGDWRPIKKNRKKKRRNLKY